MPGGTWEDALPQGTLVAPGAAEPRNGESIMRIHVGCELSFDFPQATPLIAILNVHFGGVSDLEPLDHLMTRPCSCARHGISRQLWQLVQSAGDAGRPLYPGYRHGNPRHRASPMWPNLYAVQHQIQQLPWASWIYSPLAAAIAKQTASPMRPGDCSRKILRRGGHGCRRSATSSTITSPSATTRRAPRGPRQEPTLNGAGFAATSPIWPSPLLPGCLNIPARYCTGYVSGIRPCRFLTKRGWILLPGWKFDPRRTLAHFRSAQQCASGGARAHRLWLRRCRCAPYA